MFRLSLCLFFTLITPPALSQWYESQGQALIHDNDKSGARTKAIENALKKTLLIAGASVSSIQQVVNGLLTKDEVNIRATGVLNALEVVSESYSENLVKVTIRSDIFPKEKQCFSADFRKSILLTRSNLVNREQANVGELYALDRVTIEKLNQKLNDKNNSLTTLVSLQNKTPFSRLNQSQQRQKLKNLTISLADVADSQYVMYSEITDLSLAPSTNKKWQFWQQDIRERHFNLVIYIFNGSNGEKIFEKNYQSHAPWTYEKTAHVNVNGYDFWQSQYGMSIDQVLTKAQLDINEELMCLPTQGTIVHIEKEKLMINLGRKHGVKVGDEFTLLSKANRYTDNKKIFAGFHVSPFKVKVIQSTQDSSTLTSSNGEQLGNIQINDLAVRY